MENNEVAKLTDADIRDAYMWLMYNKNTVNAVAWEAAMNNVRHQMLIRNIEAPKEEEY